MELTGLQNPMVKAAAELKQKKYRQQQGLFLAEGLRTVEEAVRYGAVQSIFYTAIEDDRTRAVLEEAAGKRLDDFLASGKMLLVLDRVMDPGNIGTMLRTADAAGVGGLLLLQGCADIYAPKTVRASMGSLFHLPVLSGLSEELLVQAARKAGYELLVTCLDGADNLYKADLQGRLAFVMGNEANGVSDALLAAADKRVFIPMQGRAESLNVAMAAGIVMFEALRQRLK